jgi:pimeloyl-ACP methyl ester carboxylesterase
MEKMEKKFVELSNGERLAYIERGTGKNYVVLIHGNMSSSLHYLPLFSRLPSHLHLIAIDLRGFGDSSYKNRFDSLYELADDVIEMLKVLKISKFAVVGWSAGGGVALRLAAKLGEKVSKVVLIDSMSLKGIPVLPKDEKGAPIFGKVYPNKEAMGLDPIQVLPIVNALAQNNVAFMAWLWDAFIYTNKKPTAEENAIYLAETMKQRNLVDFDWSLVTFNMGSGSNLYRDGDGSIEKIKSPVLAFWGRKDKTVIEYMINETVASLKDKAKLVIFEEAGHSPLVDVPDELSKLMAEFIG